MTIEVEIANLLKAACPRVFPDVAPLDTARPYVTFQQVGGVAVGFVDPLLPSKKNGRFQINCWADTRIDAAALALQIENAFLGSAAMQANPVGGPVAVYEPDRQLYGTHQDFSVWSDR